MTSNGNADLLNRAKSGDTIALGELFNVYRDRLKMMVRLRLDRRLQGRLDPSDVIQDAFVDIKNRFSDYALDPSMSCYLWMRFLTAQKLVDLHRYHLGTAMRDAAREVPILRCDAPEADSSLIAAHLLERLTTASEAAIRVETRVKVQQALDAMDPIDREVLLLRHFELLSNEDTARLLGLSKTAASNRYIRALRRLKAILESVGIVEN